MYLTRMYIQARPRAKQASCCSERHRKYVYNKCSRSLTRINEWYLLRFKRFVSFRFVGSLSHRPVRYEHFDTDRQADRQAETYVCSPRRVLLPVAKCVCRYMSTCHTYV